MPLMASNSSGRMPSFCATSTVVSIMFLERVEAQSYETYFLNLPSGPPFCYLRDMANAPLPLPTRWVVGLLGVKMLCALGYAYLYFHLRPGTSDVWGYYDQSRQLAAMIHSSADFF